MTLLSIVFPSSERSGINLKGEYNLANVTIVDEDTRAKAMYDKLASRLNGTKSPFYQPVFEKVGDISVPDFHAKFWNLQKYFTNPTLLLNNTIEYNEFKETINLVLDVFH